MLRLAQDPDRVRKIVRLLLQQEASGLSDKACTFLEQLRSYSGEPVLTSQQQEFLYGLIQRSTKRSRVGPYKASTLAMRAYEARADLDDDESELWLESLHAQGPGLELYEHEWERLLGICRRLDLIYRDEWVQLPTSSLL